MPTPKNKYFDLFDEDTAPIGKTLLVVGIASPQKAYRLVWQINTIPDIELSRVEDLFYRHRKGEDIFIACFEFTNEENGFSYRLVANKTSNNILIPEHKNTDYFLLVKGGLEETDRIRLVADLKKLTFALAVYEIDFASLKNKDILYF